jgi:Fe-S-cluster containining protein
MSVPPAPRTVVARDVTPDVTRDASEWVERLYGVVDALVAPIAAAHVPPLACRAGCHGCCSDSLTVFEIEAAVIAHHHGDLLALGDARAPGACAFLDERGECRVYAHRPYVCRTQGLPLRWLEHDADGELAEMRDVCPLNAEGLPVEELAAADCWTIGPIEERLATRQASIDGGEGRRVALRSLFARERRHLPVTR